MNEIGMKVIKDYQTIMKWNRVFRVNEFFPHPNYYVEMGKSNQPVFLETFPEVKLELSRWAKLNMMDLNCESIGVQMKQKILPKTYQTYLEDCGLDNQHLSYPDFLRCFHLKSISDSTIWRWMKYLGFNFCERRKNYYCDKHEDEMNVQYREKFIKEYFKYEQNKYRWVHLSEDEAIKLEEMKEDKLLENTFIEYEENNENMREYHVDTHPIFMSDQYEKNISTRRDPALTRPLMMIGQDETVFKQYSFSRK